MVLQYERILTALREIPNLTVIDGSDEADEAGLTLPALVLDFEPTRFTTLGESAGQFFESPQFSFVLYSEKDSTNRRASRELLRSRTGEVIRKILEVYPDNRSLDEPYVVTATFQTGDAYAFGGLITLSEEVFEL